MYEVTIRRIRLLQQRQRLPCVKVLRSAIFINNLVWAIRIYGHKSAWVFFACPVCDIQQTKSKSFSKAEILTSDQLRSSVCFGNKLIPCFDVSQNDFIKDFGWVSWEPGYLRILVNSFPFLLSRWTSHRTFHNIYYAQDFLNHNVDRFSFFHLLFDACNVRTCVL